MPLSNLLRCSTMWVAAALPLLTTAAWTQTKAQKRAQEYDKAARATVLHDANVYVAADADAQKISLVTPGHEVVVVERNGPWVKGFANTDVQDDANDDDRNKTEFGEDANVTPASGWIRDKGVVGPTTPGGDAVIYGSAANFEGEAEQPHAPKGAGHSAPPRPHGAPPTSAGSWTSATPAPCPARRSRRPTSAPNSTRAS